eukprot:snap_masked-scaffold1523_size37540-processed-gene-0.9 protein:Tk02355 transcript:snap_masked-scaffold1523_size37540-processed-gene-0.9-mRNA-1 annotation:"sodium hydrogen"
MAVSTDDPGAHLLFHLNLPGYLNTWSIVLFLTLTALVLIVLKETRLHRCSEKIPESCILILVGILTAVMAWGVGILHPLSEVITHRHFFDFLLPPIILDAAYHLYCKSFIMNLDGILVLAVVGTSLNVFLIGGLLHLTYGMALAKCLLLASIVSAVDPVAVLAVFNQVGVQEDLYFLIFGESLFNDGVTVVYFDTLDQIAFIKVEAMTHVYAVLSFFTIALGGFLIGALFGVLTALVFRLMGGRDNLLFPYLTLTLAYLGFLSAQMFHWSGILALIGVGLVQKRYAFPNLSDESVGTIDKITHLLATATETIIFLVLGFSVFKDRSHWDGMLILYTIVFCLVARFGVTFGLGYLVNLGRRKRLSLAHLFMMSSGGLRGAVSFAMAASVSNHEVRGLFMTTTLSVILFTVFVQGALVRPLVNYFNFQSQPKEDTYVSTLAQTMNRHILAGMEAILQGSVFTSIDYWLERLDAFDRRHVQPYLVQQNEDNGHMFRKLRRRNTEVWQSIPGRYSIVHDIVDTAIAEASLERPGQGASRLHEGLNLTAFQAVLHPRRSVGTLGRNALRIRQERLNERWIQKKIFYDQLRDFLKAREHLLC